VSDTSATSVSQTEIVGIRDVITASAGGVIVTTDDSIGGYVGAIVIMDYLYSFGNMKKNGEVYMQPAGNLDFAADCFQLIGSEILASDVNGVDAGDRDQIYYVLPSNTNGSDHEIEVRYYFLNLCEGVSTEARGYAAATSGNDLKLSPNIGDPSIDFSLPEAVSPFVISKSVDVLSVAPGESAAYTVTLTNSSAQSIVVDQIKDVLPPDFTFDTTLFNSDINVTNAAKFPSRGDADTLRWWGGTASSTYPYREFLLGPGSSLNLRYTASASLSPAPGEYINYAQAISGSYATPYVAATLCVGGYPCTLQAGEWQFFEAVRIAGGIRLAWSVFQVASSVSFAVERSRNGSDFEAIASLAGDAFAGETNAYEYEDPLPPSPIGGATCYRIKWIHADGLASYSPIESVFQAQHAQPALHIYTAGGPNRFRIQYNQPATGKIKFRITDSVGHTILSRTEQSNSLEVSGLPSGMYMVRVSDGKVATSSKFIVSGQ
jgi:uncharacterized repeat protein (TIGR01451 family)